MSDDSIEPIELDMTLKVGHRKIRYKLGITGLAANDLLDITINTDKIKLRDLTAIKNV